MSILNLIGGIILAIVVGLIVVTITNLLKDGCVLREKVQRPAGDGTVFVEKRWKNPFASLEMRDWILALVFAVIAGVNDVFAEMLTAATIGFSIPLAVSMLVLVAFLVYWFACNGYSLKEFIWFTILTAILCAVMRISMSQLRSWVGAATFWGSVFRFLPGFIETAAIGFYAFWALHRHAQKASMQRAQVSDEVLADYPGETEDKVDERRKKVIERTNELESKAKTFNVFSFIVLGLTVVALICMLIWGGIKWNLISLPSGDVQEPVATVEPTPEPTQEPEPEPLPTIEPEEMPAPPTEETWYIIHGYELLDNDDPDDDFNFGPNAYKEGMTAEEADELFRQSLLDNPALGAGAIAIVDVRTNNRYLGLWTDGKDEDEWMEIINSAKDLYIEDQSAYLEMLEGKEETNTGFFAFLDRATPEIKEVNKTEDQMYMNYLTPSGIPDVVVFKTPQEKSHILVYTWRIKGRAVSVAYRMECYFQPIDVAEDLNVVPKTNPVVNPTPVPTSTPAPAYTPPIYTPTPTVTPTPTLPVPSAFPVAPKGQDGQGWKDESTRPAVTGYNDVYGPGDPTNNGWGAWYSSKDKPTDSEHLTPSEFQGAIDYLNGVNAGADSRPGGSDNSPTYSAPPSMDIVNNGNSGTSHNGNNGIDNQTTQSGTGHIGGQVLGNGNEQNAAGEYGGPPL